VAEEYDVEQVWVGRVLQEKPDNTIILTFCSSFCIPLVWESFLFQYFTLVFNFCTFGEQKNDDNNILTVLKKLNRQA
jgi:hypothetical protein